MHCYMQAYFLAHHHALVFWWFVSVFSANLWEIRRSKLNTQWSWSWQWAAETDCISYQRDCRAQSLVEISVLVFASVLTAAVRFLNMHYNQSHRLQHIATPELERSSVFSTTQMHSFVSLSMRSMRSMRGGFIFRNWGPSLKVHYGHWASVSSMTLVDRLPGPHTTARSRLMTNIYMHLFFPLVFTKLLTTQHVVRLCITVQMV